MKTSAKALAAAVLALSLASSGARADPFFWAAGDSGPSRLSWTDAILGQPTSGPPWATPVLAPTLGCYLTRARIRDAWRRVEVCY
jgi:hypothetical protein